MCLRTVLIDFSIYYESNCLFRYETFWLPFLASESSSVVEDMDFCPPLDIHWVWHVHMLSPREYAKDCR